MRALSSLLVLVLLSLDRLELHCINSMMTFGQGVPWLARDFRQYGTTAQDIGACIRSQVRQSTI